MPQHESAASRRVRRRTRKALPRLRPGTPGRPTDKRYKEQFGLIIICPNERVQAQLYRAFTALPDCKFRVVVT